MKRLGTLFLALCIAMPAFGIVRKSRRVDCSSSNVGTSFNTTSPQLFWSGVTVTSRGIDFYNGTSSWVEVNDAPTAASAPTSDSGTGVYVPPNSGKIIDFPNIKGNLYIRCITSACTTGFIAAHALN